MLVGILHQKVILKKIFSGT